MGYCMTERERARADWFALRKGSCMYLTTPDIITNRRNGRRHYKCSYDNMVIGDPIGACKGCKKFSTR